MKEKKSEAQKQHLRKIMDKVPTQSKAPGEIQGFSKSLRKNEGQGRGQRVKAHENQDLNLEESNK